MNGFVYGVEHEKDGNLSISLNALGEALFLRCREREGKSLIFQLRVTNWNDSCESHRKDSAEASGGNRGIHRSHAVTWTSKNVFRFFLKLISRLFLLLSHLSRSIFRNYKIWAEIHQHNALQVLLAMTVSIELSLKAIAHHLSHSSVWAFRSALRNCPLRLFSADPLSIFTSLIRWLQVVALPRISIRHELFIAFTLTLRLTVTSMVKLWRICSQNGINITLATIARLPCFAKTTVESLKIQCWAIRTFLIILITNNLLSLQYFTGKQQSWDL